MAGRRSRVVVHVLDPALPTVTLRPLRPHVVTSSLPSGDGADLADRLASHPAVGSVRAVVSELVPAHLHVAHADVVAVDIGATTPQTAALGQLLRATPTPVAVLSRTGDVSGSLAALRSGAAGYFCHDLDVDELVFGLRRIALGQPAVDPALAGSIISELAARHSHPAAHPTPSWDLRPREHEVVGLLAEGLSNRQIAQRLGLSHETVKSHLGTAYRRMGVASRSEAIALYHRTGERLPPAGAPTGGG